MTDIRQVPEYATYLKSVGWITERIGGINYFIKRLPLVGSVIKIQRPKYINFKNIDLLLKKYKALRIIIEPDISTNHKLLTLKGFKLSSNPFLPTMSLIIDLNKNKQELEKSLKKDCRSAISKNRKNKLIICNKQKLKLFHQNWKKSVGFRRFIPSYMQLKSLKEIFRNKALLLMDGESRSGAIFLIGAKTAYYWQAFTSKEGRKSQIQYKIVWEGILWAKNRGCTIFDFEGIYDERFPNKSWLGFTHFKKSFGGYEIKYPGAYNRNNFVNLLKF